MTTTSFVRRHVNNLKEGQMFATADVLAYGPRLNVDFTLKELVRKGKIVRLSRGLYMRGDETTALPAPAEVAAFKARYLGLDFDILDAEDFEALKLPIPNTNSKEITFWVGGGSSNFSYGEIKIILKEVGARKLQQLKRLKNQALLKRTKFRTNA